MGFLVRLRLLQGHHLGLGHHAPLLRDFRFQRLQALPHRFKIVAEPETPHPSGGNRQLLFPQFISDPHLPPGRLLNGQGDDRVFHYSGHPILEQRLPPRDLLQRRVAPGVVEFLEPIKAVLAVDHDLAGPGDIPQMLGSFHQAHIVLDNLADPPPPKVNA